MKELSLHILDIVGNSVSANATKIRIGLKEEGICLVLTVADNGCGMSADFLARATDPFTTTRTTRKVGMGIPLLKMAAEQAGGSFHIESTPGVGTSLTATFILTHLDRPPVGDMAATMVTLIQGSPDIDFVYTHTGSGGACRLDTAELRETLEDVPLNSPPVLAWIQAYLEENDFPDTAFAH